MAHQQPGVFDLQCSLLDRRLRGLPQPLQDEIGVVLHLLEHVCIGVSPHDVIEQVAVATGVKPHMHSIRASEEVVEIAHHLLVGPAQKHADPVRLVLVEGM